MISIEKTGSGADLEHSIARFEFEQFGHQGDDVWLADRLPRSDREGMIAVRLALIRWGYELVAGNGEESAENALVGDPPVPDLLPHHQ
jgi:hypothetical protein